MASTQGPDVLVGVADAILEGTGVDWSSAETNIDAAQAGLLPHLKILSVVADLHRNGPETATAPQHWGHLTLLERIGAGAFGEVYRAWDTRLDREVALKLLPPGSASVDARATTIINEGRLLARVRHPNVVTIYGAERLGDRVGLWMEFVKGRTLEQMVQDGRRFSPAEAIDIGVQLSRAVAAVHDAGLLHRDIKAQNVMLADDGRVMLMDFGTGLDLKAVGETGLAGTPRYLAPELFAGGAATTGSDLYSLGVLLHRIVTGAYPVAADDLPGLREAHARAERTRVRDAGPAVPAGLARAIDRLLDPDPSRRPSSATTLGRELDDLRKSTWSRPWARAVMATAAMALIVVLASVVQGRQPAIAVLPFAVDGMASDGRPFGDGLTDEVIRHLAGIDGLQVRSRPPSETGATNSVTSREIGDTLDADYLVRASVARSDQVLRVTASLIRVAGDVTIWTDAWDASVGDTFAIQDRITRAVAATLRLTVRRSPRQQNANPRVQQAYLTARGLMDRRGTQEARRAIDLFKEVISLDESFAPAWAGLVNAYAAASMTYQSVTIQEALPIMRRSALRALDLDPDLAEAHAAMGAVHSRDFNWDASVESYRRALALDPALTQAATAYVLWTLTPLERFDEAEQVLEHARIYNPLSLDLKRELGNLYLLTERYAEALKLYEAVLAVDSMLPFVRIYSAETLGGRPQDAVARLEREALERKAAGLGDGGGNHGYLAHAYVKAGRRADAERLLEPTRDFPQRHVLVHAALGNADGVFEALDRQMVTDPHRVPRLLVYPEMAIVRGDPRLAELRKRLNLPGSGSRPR